MESTEAPSLSESVSAVLESLLTSHSQGPETTIYADSVALQTINASFTNGILGLLQSGQPGSPPRARNVKHLGQQSGRPDTAAGLPDGSHVLFLVGASSWPRVAWPAIAQILGSCVYSTCTLCVATPEAVWGDVAAASPPAEGGIRQPLTRSSVVAALVDAMRQGRQRSALGDAALGDDAVAVETVPLLATMSLTGDLFVMPDTSHVFPALVRSGGPGGDALGFLRTRSRPSGSRGSEASAADTRQQIEQLSLNIVSLLRGLGLRGGFYSLGDTARRTARRCAGISQNADSAGSAGGLRDAVVVLVDRTADLVAPMHHGGHLLDEIYRALPPHPAGGGLASDRIVRAPAVPDTEDGSGLPGLIPGHSFLALLRSCQQGEAALRSSVDLWEAMLMQDKPVALQVLRSGLASILATEGNGAAGVLDLTRGKATAEQIQALVDACRSLPQAKGQSEALVEVAQAVVDTESAGRDERWKEAEGAEKTLALVIGGIKDALADAQVPGPGRSGEYSTEDSIVDEEICAVWDQVLSAIPPLALVAVERSIQADRSADSSELAENVSRWLWQHTPAPGMVLLAASLLAPAGTGVPRGQRAAAEQRLEADFAAVYGAAAAARSPLVSKEPAPDVARQWALRVMGLADLVVASEGQRSGLAHWRALATMSAGRGGAYASLLKRVAVDVLSGSGRCGDLEHAEQGAAVAAANLLRGLGQRLLSGDRQGAGGGGAGEAARRSSAVVFIVIGGVTFAEAAAVAAAARQHGGARRVLVGGTTICSAGSGSAMM
ncbi:Sec1 domain-containing protein 2 [Coemansia biformis]|uniref:Sec1 domain-containing protein 2 n=1 Tax=Coemansia biformis TaxID=1286918 RepID=A0A9W7YHX6_9FUNG|nr:Sec1 domain-containing protein 2 [Coemansia biformis]